MCLRIDSYAQIVLSIMLQKIKSFLSKGNCAQWCVFFLFAFVLFVKCILFHWDAFHSILVSSAWRDPLSFYKFYMAKLLMPLFIASFVFVTKRYWWTIIVSLLVDIWCIANLIYFKTYDAFLSVNDMLLVGNMDGAWSSITAYFDGCMIIMLSLTVIWGIFVYMSSISIETPKWTIFIFSLFILFGCTYLNNYFIHNIKFWPGMSKEEAAQLEEEQEEWISFVNEHGGHERRYSTPFAYIPFYQIYSETTNGIATINANFMEQYIRQQSILSDFIAINIYHMFNRNVAGHIISLSEEDIKSIRPYIGSDISNPLPKNNLIVILVESLEDWPFHHAIENQEITPYINKLTQQEHVLYCDKIKCQTLGGNSGDGQMIVNSGLLPIQNGVACMHYGDNKYPNFAHFYPNSILVNPWPKIWNQDTMSVRYSYTQKVEPNSGEWEDAKVLETSIEHLKNVKTPTCLMAITVSTHSPFNRIRNNKIQTKAPSILNRYMQCLNYTDSCIANFMNDVLTDSLLSQSTIVITGDHTIFKPVMLNDFYNYAKEQNLSIVSGDNYCPLIIYSPRISENIHVADTCYQMDIFPTILHLIGCEDYYWKGFGVNLMDSVARHNRSISEKEAYNLSDKLIRSNYFATIDN